MIRWMHATSQPQKFKNLYNQSPINKHLHFPNRRAKRLCALPKPSIWRIPDQPLVFCICWKTNNCCTGNRWCASRFFKISSVAYFFIYNYSSKNNFLTQLYYIDINYKQNNITIYHIPWLGDGIPAKYKIFALLHIWKR